MREAWRRSPVDLDLTADMANWLSDAGRLDEALVIIEEAMRVDPTYDCAVHTAHRLRFARDQDPAHLVALADFIREYPVSSHEHTDLADSCAGHAWLGRLTPATEACMNMLGQVPAATRASGLEMQVTLSALEVPSAIATCAACCRA